MTLFRARVPTSPRLHVEGFSLLVVVVMINLQPHQGATHTGQQTRLCSEVERKVRLCACVICHQIKERNVHEAGPRGCVCVCLCDEAIMTEKAFPVISQPVG